MRRLLLLVLILVPVASRAQRSRPFAEKGDLALVVGISPVSFPDITSAFNGVGVRYYATDRSVVGLSVGISTSTLDRDDSSDGRGTGSGRITVWNEHHIGRRHGPVSPFVGGGISAGYSRETFTYDDGFPCDPGACPDEPSTVVARQTRTSVGVGALLGAEVRLARGITLGAAYTLGLAVERVSVEDNQAFGGDGLTIVSGGTGLTDLHLSVYF